MAERVVARAGLAGVVAFLLLGGTAAAEVLPASDLWGKATAAADSGAFGEADAGLTELIEAGRQTDLKRFPLFADSAAGLAKQAHAEDNAPLSTWALAAAARLDPESASVSFSAADLARQQGQWPRAAGQVLNGFRHLLEDYASSLRARSDLLLVLLLALGLTTLGMAIALAFRHGRTAAHDFRETLGGLSPGTASVVAFALLFLPLFLWLGPMWLVAWWLALFFPYGNWKERTAIALLLVLMTLAPLALAKVGRDLAALESPVMQAAIATQERAYDPDAIPRILALLESYPEEPLLHFLLGNLYMFQGSEPEAQLHYRRAVQIDESLAGAHLNMGNIHFLNNDFAAAIARYERAGALEPSNAVPPYNHSVAAGELYRFDEQGAQIAEANRRDRSLTQRLQKQASSRPMKVVMFDLPTAEAWALAERIAREGKARELYANYAWLDLGSALRNPFTLAGVAGLVLMAVFWMLRRNGRAGSCIKCGRTFCPRCKSSRESATYCTQCIHIYLKRDGVSLDTKRKKLNEVQDHQTRTVRLRRILGSLLPGSPRVLDGSPFTGGLVLLLFLFLVALAVLIGRLAPLGASADTMKLFVRSGAIALAAIVWLVFAIPAWRARAVQ